jgi:hypothetical protein
MRVNLPAPLHRATCSGGKHCGSICTSFAKDIQKRRFPSESTRVLGVQIEAATP